MDWDDVHSFLAIARARSLSGAARELGVQQSTMSRRLDGLEARAGARLLQRTPRGYELTALGEAVLGNAERMEPKRSRSNGWSKGATWRCPAWSG